MKYLFAIAMLAGGLQAQAGELAELVLNQSTPSIAPQFLPEKSISPNMKTAKDFIETRLVRDVFERRCFRGHIQTVSAPGADAGC